MSSKQLYLLYLDIVQRCSVEDEVMVYYELIALGFNDELREKVSGDVACSMRCCCYS